MDPTARNSYLDTQILTATPQRLRLMLIEGAIRQAHNAQAARQAGSIPEALEAINHCRNIVSELIAGIKPDETPVARQVLGIYMFLFSTLVEAQFASDVTRLADVVRVLEEERQTWQLVCQQVPERPVAAASSTVEELAPSRVAESLLHGYGPVPSSRVPSVASAFSIEA